MASSLGTPFWSRGRFWSIFWARPGPKNGPKPEKFDAVLRFFFVSKNNTHKFERRSAPGSHFESPGEGPGSIPGSILVISVVFVCSIRYHEFRIPNASGCDLLYSRGSSHEDCGSDFDIFVVFVFSISSTVASTVPSLDACNEARTVASELIPRITEMIKSCWTCVFSKLTGRISGGSRALFL